MIRFFLMILSVSILAMFCRAQSSTASTKKKTVLLPLAVSPIKSSPAYAELLLRRTEREAELEELLLDYTEEYPKVKEFRFELDSIKEEMDRVLEVKAAEADKLTLALGKLMVRKIELQTDVWKLRQQYSNDHPEVKRMRRKIEIFEKAIKEIL